MSPVLQVLCFKLNGVMLENDNLKDQISFLDPFSSPLGHPEQKSTCSSVEVIYSASNSLAPSPIPTLTRNRRRGANSRKYTFFFLS